MNSLYQFISNFFKKIFAHNYHQKRLDFQKLGSKNFINENRNISADLSMPMTWKLAIFFNLSAFGYLSAQINNNGCVGAGFGIDAGVFSNIIEYGDGTPAAGSRDWFFSAGTGKGTIDESNTATIMTSLMSGNPIYEERMNVLLSSFVDGQLWIDGLYAREQFGGTGFTDQTSYATASKNGEDPAIWDPGTSNVLGKNDLIDVAGHMFRDGNTLASDLWFVGLINRAEPGGAAYMDFEFYVEDVDYNPGSGFTSGGPDLGHTAFQFDGSGNITKIGDILFNVALINGGETADVQMRLWVSRADYDANNTPPGFNFGPEYDGAFNGAPFGYASIIPNITDICGIVNTSGQTPPAPPWGTRGTKSNTFQTTYAEFSVVEVGVNMTALGLDHASLLGADPCFFPLNTFMVKTRASASFTAQLKDFAGPYEWGAVGIGTQIVGDPPLISCLNPTITLSADPPRPDATYTWTTDDGEIISDPNAVSIMVSKPGSYTLQTILDTGCPIDDAIAVVAYDPTKPFFDPILSTSMVACNGNDGSIDATVSGATAPYSFMWSNGAMTEDISGLSPGTYELVVTDDIGCTISAMVTVDARTPTVVTPAVTNVACNGESTGSIDLTVTGQSPFTYMWSTGDISEDIFNIPAGSYNVTVTDADGCEEIVSGILVDEPDPIVLSVVATDETDNTLDDGSVTLTVDSGGTPNFSYLWSNGAMTKDLAMVPAGIYSVVVTDMNGCTAEISAQVFEPEICDDGIDNDGDGLTDCADPDCTPTTPGTITPSMAMVCVGNMGVTYTIVDVGEDTYNWTVPAGAMITAGQGTVQITVNWISKVGGNICVVAETDGCISPTSCITVVVNDVPAKPGVITAF